MNLSAPFIRRPVATTLLTLGAALAGAVAFFLLPVSPLPQVDFPTISVQAQLPGASPETVATSVATPLERHLGQIADVTEITSSSSVGQTRITLQFGLDRNIDGAARDVQAAINAARADLPASLRSNPTYRKVNPADAPVLIFALTSDTLSQGQLYDSAATVLQQKLSQVQGIGQVTIGGSSLPAVRVELNPHALFKYGIGLEDVRAALAAANANPRGRPVPLAGCRLPQRLGRAPVRPRRGDEFGGGFAQSGPRQRQALGAADPLPPARRQHHRHRRPRHGAPAAARGVDPPRHRRYRGGRPYHRHPGLAARCRAHAGDLGRAGHHGGVPVPPRCALGLDPERRRAGVAHRHLRRHVPVRLQPRRAVSDGAHHRHRVRRSASPCCR